MKSMYPQLENPLMKMLPDSNVNKSFNPRVSYVQQGGWFKSRWNDTEEVSAPKTNRSKDK